MRILETDRLLLRHMTEDDAQFFLELLNEPGWINNIGDRGIRTVEECAAYITRVYVAGYEKNGFGLYLVELKETDEPVGICGLVKRDSLENVDVGFAFKERYWRRGYAAESAAAALEYGHNTLGIERIVAITSQTNHGSARVLEKIGLKFERLIKLGDSDHEERLFS
jgi:RimJ/RimL family protein N-acetyltransferase